MRAGISAGKPSLTRLAPVSFSATLAGDEGPALRDRRACSRRLARSAGRPARLSGASLAAHHHDARRRWAGATDSRCRTSGAFGPARVGRRDVSESSKVRAVPLNSRRLTPIIQNCLTAHRSASAPHNPQPASPAPSPQARSAGCLVPPGPEPRSANRPRPGAVQTCARWAAERRPLPVPQRLRRTHQRRSSRRQRARKQRHPGEHHRHTGQRRPIQRRHADEHRLREPTDAERADQA